MTETTKPYASSSVCEVETPFEPAGSPSVSRRLHTLLITCAGTCARCSMLGDLDNQEVLFLRTLANVIPPMWAADRRITTAVETAIASGVNNIVVCGHSYCTALEERLAGDAVSAQDVPLALAGEKGPTTSMQKMLRNLRAAATLQERVRQNVVAQLRNLESYPAVARARVRGEVRLHGWIYLDQSGMVLSYDFRRGEFVPLSEQAQDAQGEDAAPTELALAGFSG